jgi:hypothetical protein
LKLCGKLNLDNISLDRKNNDKGYDKNNVNLCCLFCNMSRSACKVKRWKRVMNILRGKKHTIDFTKYTPRRNVCELTGNQAKPNNLTSAWCLKVLKDNDFKCPLTGLPIYFTEEPFFPWNASIDRIDGSKGHLQNNCIVTCRFINMGKNAMPTEDFKVWFKKRFPKINLTEVIYPTDYKEKFFVNRQA